MFNQLKAIIAGALLLVALTLAGLIYWRASSNATTKNDLRVARETIKVEREALKITHAIDMRVNAEGVQTANKAQEAASEIESIRSTRNSGMGAEVRDAGAGARTDADDSTGAVRCDDRCTRVLQLAREARAAAVASAARLQSEGTGAR